MDQFHHQQDGLSDWINIKCSSMLFTRNAPKPYGTCICSVGDSCKNVPAGVVSSGNSAKNKTKSKKTAHNLNALQ